MTVEETLTSGMVGKEVKLEFSEEWENFSKTLVFSAGEISRDAVVAGDVAVIPHEVLAEARKPLYVGVYGVGADGRVIPTVRAQGPFIQPGAEPSGEESLDPTLPVWAQLQQQIAELRESIPDGDGLHVTDDGAGNIVMDEAGTGTISDDGAGNIIITTGGA